jgi:hypothetical protein
MLAIIGTIWGIVTLLGIGYGILSPIQERKRIQKMYKDF